jgi:hypothetical protein
MLSVISGFLGLQYTDASEWLRDVTGLHLGRPRRPGSSCLAVKHIWTAGDAVQSSSAPSLFCLVIQSLTFSIVIKYCYFVFRFFSLEALWLFLWLVVRVGLDYADAEPSTPHLCLDTHSIQGHCKLNNWTGYDAGTFPIQCRVKMEETIKTGHFEMRCFLYITK